MRNHRQFPTLAIVIAAIAALVALVVALYLLGAAFSMTSALSRDESERISLWILLFGSAIMVTLFGAFLYVGIDDWRNHLPISALYPPLTAVKGAMALYMLTVAANVVDLLFHDLHPRWTILTTPAARIVQSVLLLTVFLAFLWVLVALLEVRARERQRVRHRTGLALRIESLERRMRHEEGRNTAIEARADVAHERADATDIEQGVQDERITSVEEVTEITHTVTKKSEVKGETT